jgi:hypothetical protein
MEPRKTSRRQLLTGLIAGLFGWRLVRHKPAAPPAVGPQPLASPTGRCYQYSYRGDYLSACRGCADPAVAAVIYATYLGGTGQAASGSERMRPGTPA